MDTVIVPNKYNFSYDTHTLYINSGVATNEQLTQALKTAMRTAAQKLGRPVKTKFKVNVIVVRGAHLGYAHVFLSNPEVYYMLTGFNPDGTERVECIDDPNWVPPKVVKTVDPLDDEEMDYDDLESFLGAPTQNKSWSDMMAEEDLQQCPKIKIPLDPIMTLPPYEYDVEQREHIKKLLVEQAVKSGNPDPDIQIPTHGHFEVNRAFVLDIDPKYSHNILCARGIPEWITEHDLKVAFTPYASDTTSLHSRKVYGRTIKESYPFVTINETRVAFITYDPNTKDAQFALLMTKKLDLVGPHNTKHQLLVSPAYKTKRPTNGDSRPVVKEVERCDHKPDASR